MKIKPHHAMHFNTEISFYYIYENTNLLPIHIQIGKIKSFYNLINIERQTTFIWTCHENDFSWQMYIIRSFMEHALWIVKYFNVQTNLDFGEADT